MAMNELDNILIKAPFDGFIEDVYLEIGDFNWTSFPVCKNNELDPMLITGEVTEKNVDQIKLGQKVQYQSY